MARLVSDLIPSNRTESLLDLAWREATRGAGKPLQCLVGRKASDFTQGFSAGGRCFGGIQGPAPPTSRDRRQGHWARLIHVDVSLHRRAKPAR
jgi:hypothetical protein